MLSKLSKDKNFSLLLKGSTLNVIAKIVGIGFGFIASLLITRKYGSDLLGEIATISSAFTLLSLIALLGNQTLVLKVLPEHIEKYSYLVASRVYQRLLTITAWFTFGVVTVWLVLEKKTTFTLLKGLEEYLPLVATLIVLSVFRELNSKTLRGLGDYKIFSALEMLPAILLAGTAIIAIGLQVPEHYFQYAYYIPLFIMSLISFFFVIKSFDSKISENKVNTKNSIALPSKSALIRTSLPMLGVTISTAIIAHFDILMLNYFTSSSNVGVYTVYVKIIGGTALATHSINSMFAPTVSKLYNSNDAFQLKSFCKKTTLLSFTATLAASVLVLLLFKPLLGLFGPEFLDDKHTLYLLITSTLIGSFFGSVGLYLNMTGHQVYFFRIMVGAAVINICLNAILIPNWGSLGAATATLISVAIWNLLATRKIFREYEYTLIWGRNHNV